MLPKTANRADNTHLYHPPVTVYSDCGEGQETADTYKACQPFLPLNSTVLFGRFASSKMSSQNPSKKWC